MAYLIYSKYVHEEVMKDGQFVIPVIEQGILHYSFRIYFYW